MGKIVEITENDSIEVDIESIVLYDEDNYVEFSTDTFREIMRQYNILYEHISGGRS